MSEQYLTIKTPVGSLRGRQEQSVLGDNYYGFQSIPYAKPPVGELRFKNPEPVEPWEGVKDAFHVSPIAPALDYFTKELDPTSNEDCLFLNVYFKQVPEEVKKPKAVMVYIHGGGFTTGSGNKPNNGPDFFLIHDIILVTLNYRLGAFGFLSLQNELCPGNFGMKDQVLALKWVQQNIASFGGDPNNVTIFGVSAGGASVHYHVLSPVTKGLFHKAIIQSGNAVTQYGLSLKPREYAFALGKRLGCDTQDEQVLMNFLMKAPCEDIIKKMEGLVFSVETVEKVGDMGLSIPFTPVIEPEAEGAFLTKHPRELQESRQYHDIPIITGITMLEGVICMVGMTETPQWTEDRQFEFLIPRNLQLVPGTELSLKVAKMIREFYFKDGVRKEDLIDFLSDSFFVYPMYRSLQEFVNKDSPNYLYMFTYDGGRAFVKEFFKCTDLKGTIHGDETGYLFSIDLVPLPLDKESKDYEIIQTLTGLWTEFAKTSSPTDKWYKVQKDKLQYLDIGQQLTMKDDFPVDRMKLWEKIYQVVRDETNVDV